MSEVNSSKPGVKRTILQSLPIPELPGWESRLVLLEYPPGLAAPIHHHPVAATGFIVEGDVVSQWEGGEVERYTKGDSFIDLGTTVHLRSENTSKTKPLKMLTSYVIKIGESNVIL
jgi:quercetin dioxygenase-like cupin family protein